MSNLRKVIAFNQVVLIEGVDGFGRLSLQMGGSSDDHSFDEQELEQLEQRIENQAA